MKPLINFAIIATAFITACKREPKIEPALVDLDFRLTVDASGMTDARYLSEIITSRHSSKDRAAHHSYRVRVSIGEETLIATYAPPSEIDSFFVSFSESRIAVNDDFISESIDGSVDKTKLRFVLENLAEKAQLAGSGDLFTIRATFEDDCTVKFYFDCLTLIGNSGIRQIMTDRALIRLEKWPIISTEQEDAADREQDVS